MFSGGTGTKEDPYLIGTVADLEAMVAYDSPETASFYKQIADIDFEWADWENPWIFHSSYDGQWHTISNVKITGGTYPSFFGYTTEQTTIQNVKIVNIENIQNAATGVGGIAGAAAGMVINCSIENGNIQNGGDYTGGIVGLGYSNSTIENCYFSGYIKGGIETGGIVGNGEVISNCRVDANIETTGHSVGSIAGSVREMYQCNATGTLKQLGEVTGDSVGVLVGNLYGKVLQCTADVKVLETTTSCGGLVGTMFEGAEIISCYSKSNIQLEAKGFLPWLRFGGLVANASRKNIKIKNSYYMGNINITTPDSLYDGYGNAVLLGGLIAEISYNAEVEITNCFTACDITLNNQTATPIESFKRVGRIWGYKQPSADVTACNFSLNTTTYNGSTIFPDEDKTLEGKDGEDITIEQLKDKNTYIEKGWDFENVWDINEYYNDGFPHLRWESTEIKKIGPGDYIKLEKQNEKKVIKKVVSTFNFDGDDIVYTAGEGEEHETLKIENPFMTQDIVSYVQSQLNDFEYVPYNMSWRCWPQLEPGDFYLIETRKGEILETFIMSNKITFRGGLKADTNAPARSQQQSEFPHKGTLTKKIEHIERTRIVEGKDYYGVRTSRDFGLKIRREDGKSEVTLNSDKMEFLVNGEKKVYFDVQEELYKFTGKIIASMFVGGTIDIGEGTFTVDDEGKVTINSGSIIITREDGNARIVISEAAGITFQKWNEVSEDWEETIGLDSEGAGVITGGTLRTAKDGRRVEVSNNQIRSYNDSGELHGLVTNNTSNNFGDWEFYNKGELIFTVYNGEDAISLIPSDGVPFVVGSERAPLNLRGSYIRINGNLVPTLPSKTAAATYGENEQQMLQEVYDKIKQVLDAINNN